MSTTNDVPGSLFQGYNSITPNVKNTCLTGEVIESSSPGDSIISICKGYQSLASAMQIDVSVSVGVAGFGGASSKYSYFHSLNITETSITVLVRTTVVNSKQQPKNVKLLEEEKANVINAVDSKKFVNKYGDSYVSAIEFGGEYIAAYVFHAETKDEVTNIETSLKASGIGDGISVDGSFSQKINTVSSSSSSRMSLTQYMSLHGTAYPGADDICDFALKYPKLAEKDNTVLSYSLTGYEDENISELAGALDAAAANRNYFLGVSGILTGKLEELQTLISNKAQADEVLNVYKYYNPNFSDTVLTSNIAAIKADIANIRKQLIAYFLNPTAEIESIELPALDLGYPTLKLTFSQKTAGHNENNGVYAEDITDLTGFIRKRNKIAEFKLYGDSNVVGLATTYFVDGKEVTQTHGKQSEYISTLDLRGDSYYPLTSYQASEWGGNLKNLSITANGKTINMGVIEDRANYTIPTADGEFFISLGARVWGDHDDNIITVKFNFAKFVTANWVTPN